MENYFFTSERIGFRQWQTRDEAPFIAMNADPQVMEFFPALMPPEDSLGLIRRIKNHIHEKAYGFFATELLETREFIGFIGFGTPRFEASFTPCTEIGWRLKASVWNQGLATEGALRCLEYGFETLHFDNVYSFTSVLNKRSERIMQKIGMSRQNTFDHPLIEAGHPIQKHILYVIHQQEFIPK